MKKLFLLICCFCVALMSAGCGGQKSEADMKVLKVGTTANFPPFEYFQPNTGMHTGFDIDIIKDLGASMGYDKVEFVNVDFAKILDGLAEKKYDVAISGMAITPERQEVVNFTEPYIKDGLTIVVPVGTKMPNKVESLKGKRVAVETCSLASSWLMDNDYAGEVVLTASTEDAIKAVVNDEADCMVASKLSVAFLLAHGFSDSVRFAGNGVLLEDRVAIAVSKDNDELLQKLNSVLEKYRKSAAYKQLYRTYFGNM